jgi:hypothetical protein
MNLAVSVYIVALFVALTPGILLRLPKKGSNFTVAAVHAIIFAVIFYFTAKTIWRATATSEGFQEGPPLPLYISNLQLAQSGILTSNIQLSKIKSDINSIKTLTRRGINTMTSAYTNMINANNKTVNEIQSALSRNITAMNSLSAAANGLSKKDNPIFSAFIGSLPVYEIPPIPTASPQ